MRGWLDGMRGSESWRRRVIVAVPVAFSLLTFIFVYDRSYLDTALIVLDEHISPLFAAHQLGGCNSAPTSDSFSSAAWTFDPPRAPSPPPPPLPTHCDVFDGEWVHDETYPLYESCRLAEQDFLCHMNGREDRRYQKWRWQPRHCRVPRFDAADMLARLRGRKVVIVGDSMGRTQWESLNCLLLQAVRDPSSVELVGGPIGKLNPHLGMRFLDHNVTVDYRRSPFMVRRGRDVPRRSPARVLTTLKLGRMDQAVTRHMIDADVLVINTGHWWTPDKTLDSGRYFQIGDKLVLGMAVMEAYTRALGTVAAWVDAHIDFTRTEVFFRSFEPSHWHMPMATLPYKSVPDVADGYEPTKARILRQAVARMRQPAALLNVTFLSSYRPDAHIFNWTRDHKFVDCSHWCLPGVPDTWNELLYVSLLLRGRGIWGSRTGTE